MCMGPLACRKTVYPKYLEGLPDFGRCISIVPWFGIHPAGVSLDSMQGSYSRAWYQFLIRLLATPLKYVCAAGLELDKCSLN